MKKNKVLSTKLQLFKVSLTLVSLWVGIGASTQAYACWTCADLPYLSRIEALIRDKTNKKLDDLLEAQIKGTQSIINATAQLSKDRIAADEMAMQVNIAKKAAAENLFDEQGCASTGMSVGNAAISLNGDAAAAKMLSMMNRKVYQSAKPGFQEKSILETQNSASSKLSCTDQEIKDKVGVCKGAAVGSNMPNLVSSAMVIRGATGKRTVEVQVPAPTAADPGKTQTNKVTEVVQLNQSTGSTPMSYPAGVTAPPNFTPAAQIAAADQYLASFITATPIVESDAGNTDSVATKVYRAMLSTFKPRMDAVIETLTSISGFSRSMGASAAEQQLLKGSNRGLWDQIFGNEKFQAAWNDQITKDTYKTLYGEGQPDIPSEMQLLDYEVMRRYADTTSSKGHFMFDNSADALDIKPGLASLIRSQSIGLRIQMISLKRQNEANMMLAAIAAHNLNPMTKQDLDKQQTSVIAGRTKSSGK